MKQLFIITILSLVSCTATPINSHQTVESTQTQGTTKEAPIQQPADTIPLGAQKLILSYPTLALKYADNRIIFPDGEGIIYDDGRKKSFIELLDDCDVEDMFSMQYDTWR